MGEVEMMNSEFLKIAKMSEREARELLEAIRWANGIVCPKCGSVKGAWKLQSKSNSKNKVRAGLYRCKDCRKTFTVTMGTIFEDSHIPLHKWLLAVYMMNSNKNGVSAHELHRNLDVTYKTAWFMAHRIRFAMGEKPLGKLLGIVEADETYVGGRRRGKVGRGSENKTAVFALVERGGELRASTVANVTGRNLREIMRENVNPDAHIMTDNFKSYAALDEDFLYHDTVDHGKKEYVRGNVHVNSLGGFFSQLKRGISGSYVHVSRAHLGRYLGEFQFRYNTRKMSDAQRARKVLKRTEGKRLVYSEITSKKPAN